MTNENLMRGTSLFLAALAMTFVIMAMSPAISAEDTSSKDMDAAIRKTLVERTNTFCDAVLPAWFASKQGIDDTKVKALVADCYMSHARLTILNMNDNMSLEKVSLSEVPAIMLDRQININLDIYRPLAGRTIRIRARGK